MIIFREGGVDTILFFSPLSASVFFKAFLEKAGVGQIINVLHGLIRPLVHLVTPLLESFFKALL